MLNVVVDNWGRENIKSTFIIDSESNWSLVRQFSNKENSQQSETIPYYSSGQCSGQCIVTPIYYIYREGQQIFGRILWKI